MFTYSLIIPHKNCPDLLQRCIDTIPRREDLEVIVVDDNSLQCIDESKYNDLNITFVYDKSNKGAGHARNLGVEVATGKWLLFADADDRYTNNLRDLLDAYSEDTTTDIVYLNALMFDENGHYADYVIDRYINRYLQNRFYSEKVLRYSVFTPWTRMVKRDLVSLNGIRFDETPIGNDFTFCLTCSKYAKKIAVEEKYIYEYYRPTTTLSLTDSYRKIDTLSLVISNRLKMNQIYTECGFVFKFSIIKYYFSDIKKFGKHEVNKVYKNVLKNSGYSLVRDIVNTLIYLFGKVLRIL